MDCRSPAPVAKLLELDFAGDEFFVFGGPVIYPLTLRALQLYQSIL